MATGNSIGLSASGNARYIPGPSAKVSWYSNYKKQYTTVILLRLLNVIVQDHSNTCWGDVSIFLLLPPNLPKTLNATWAMLSSGLCNVCHKAWEN